MKKVMPQVGDRVGFTWWPGTFPEDNLGTVTKVYSNGWYDSVADVLMDDGSIETVVGAYSIIGNGAYLVQTGSHREHMPCESMTTTGGAYARQCTEFQTEGPDAFTLISCAGGGPLDAPVYIPAGSWNSTEWIGIKGALARQSQIKRF